MKRYLIFLSLVIFSCNNTTKVPVSQIEISPVVHDTLSAQQIENIRKIQAVFSEVNPSTLEETITNFKRDQHPDNEINIWLNMAAAYEKFTGTHSKAITPEKKQEAYTLILLRSMMPEAEAKNKAQIKVLADGEVTELFSYYTDAPKSVTVK